MSLLETKKQNPWEKKIIIRSNLAKQRPRHSSPRRRRGEKMSFRKNVEDKARASRSVRSAAPCVRAPGRRAQRGLCLRLHLGSGCERAAKRARVRASNPAPSPMGHTSTSTALSFHSANVTPAALTRPAPIFGGGRFCFFPTEDPIWKH